MNLLIRRSLAQCSKELAQFRRDWLTVGLAYALPFFALLMYGYATRLEAKDIGVAVFDYDNSKLSREYIDLIFNAQQFIPVRTRSQDVMDPLDRGIAKASLIIPPEFTRDIKSGKIGQLQLIVDATDVNNARVIKNAFNALNRAYLIEHNLPVQQSLTIPATRLWFNPGRKEELYIVPGAIALVTWIFPALLAAFALVREKEQGTVLQLYASSITAEELVIGKAMAYFLIGGSGAASIIASAILLFGVPIVGNPLPFLFASMLYVLNGVLFGLWAASRTDNQMATVQLCATAGFLGSMLLSGFIYPIRNITYPISLASYAVAARYYIEASRNAFVRGGDWSALWYVPLFLVAISFVLFRATVFGMRKMQLQV